VALRLFLYGACANHRALKSAMALRRQDDIDDARVTKNETLVRRDIASDKMGYRKLLKSSVVRSSSISRKSVQSRQRPLNRAGASSV
jgi:hypothetical protein